MRKYIGNILVMVGFILLLSAARVDARRDVAVVIPEYPTVIAGMDIYNPALEYPVFTYNDICYIPMTYDLCERLSLSVGFDERKGLFITNYTKPYPEECDTAPFGRTDFENIPKKIYNAQVAEYPIYLNGLLLDNINAEDPVLNIRDITYFPLTYDMAVNELKLDVKWTAEHGLVVRRDDNANEYIDRTSVPRIEVIHEEVDGSIYILLQKWMSIANYNEFGDQQPYSYHWWEEYLLSPDMEIINKTVYADYNDIPSIPYPSDKPYSKNIRSENGIVYYADKEILDLTDRPDFLSATASYEYNFVDVTFFSVQASFGDRTIPVLRYPKREEYLFIKDKNGIRQICEWNVRDNINNVIADGMGGYYICSNFTYPGETSYSVRRFGTIMHYTGDGNTEFVSVPDTNSVSAIGVHGGKLYVCAMYYKNGKSEFTEGGISPINSGYYEIDIASGNGTLLCPWFEAGIFMTTDGRLYGLSENRLTTRVVDLKNKKAVTLQ